MSHRRYQMYFFIIFLVISVGLSLALFWSYLTLIALGGVLAIICNPVYKFILRVVRKDGLAAALTVGLSFLIVLAPLVYFLVFVTGELTDVLPSIKNFLDKAFLVHYLQEKLPVAFGSQIPAVTDNLFAFVKNLSQDLSKNLLGIFRDIVGVIFGVFVTLMSSYYCLKDSAKIRAEILALSPLGDEYDNLMLNRVLVAVRAVMGGVVIVAVIKGILAAIFFAIFGIPAPLFWGAVTMVASFIPVAGSALVTVPAFMYLTLQGNYGWAFLFLAFAIGLIGTVDNFLQPKLVQSKTNIHPFLILLSIFGGLKFYGFAGFVIGPLTLAVTVALVNIYEKEFQKYIKTVEN